MSTIAAHGGTLIQRELKGRAREEALERLAGAPRVELNARGLSDLVMIANGAMSPLTGFMGQADYRRVVDEMHLTNGLPWTLPITLPVSRDVADGLREGQDVALTYAGRTVGLLEPTERYTYDKVHEARAVFRTDEEAHPGVAKLYAQGEVYLGGDVWLLERPNEPFSEYRRDPAETRKIFAERGWRRVVGFQTRNPVHRAHEYIQKCALETVDGLLLHPLVGETKADDVPADVRLRSYEVIFENYYPKDRVLLSVFPAAMRYAGPREAVFHALCRKNYGCTHFIVGRDHAGVGGYYGTYDSQRIFEEFDKEALGITPMCFEHAFYCRTCAGMATAKTCPHPDSDHVTLSGTKVRAMLRAGELPPPEFSRPEVARVLIDGMRQASVSAGS
ncbi:MAG TPA: sulfate adenylyltransferase [Limnochordia bacterium]